MKRVLSFLLLAAVMMSVGVMAHSADMAKGAKAAKAAKSKYLVIASHTPEQCLAAMDEINGMSPKSLAAWDFGCKSGDHTAYMTVMARSDDEVKAMLPASMRDQAKIVKLSKMTPADLKMAHSEMEKH